MPDRIQIFHALQVAYSALFRAADKHTRKEVGFTTSQLTILYVLLREDGQPIGYIAKVLAMGKSSLTGLIDRMSSRGLVKRRPAKGDSRMAMVFLTPSGRQTAQAAIQQTKAFNAELLKPFSETEIETAMHFLAHVSANAGSIINNSKISV